MKELFQDFEWQVYPAYHWQDWLDERGERVIVESDGVIGLESEGSVELAYRVLRRGEEGDRSRHRARLE